jgi:Family of unknown function (DUF6519)
MSIGNEGVMAMKGDFSRIRFTPKRHYTSVLQQQGRVALDADTNEQCAIDDHLRTTQAIDVIGEYGGPIDDAGFAISVSNGTIWIGKGRYYVAGMLCENPAPLAYDAQRFLIDATAASALLDELAQTGGDATLRLYLQVWQRLVTALDDPCLGEPALGQADTTARLQTVWRVIGEFDSATEPDGTTNPKPLTRVPRNVSLVKLAPAAEAPSLGVTSATGTSASWQPLSACCQAMYQATPVRHTGTLAAQTSGGGAQCGCQPIPAAGYQGLENQLYRVEIHQSGDASSATFKWSRENGSVVVAIDSISDRNVSVASLGPDANLGFQVGQWVEISDDSALFGETPNQPGELYKIVDICAASLTLTMNTTVQPVDRARHARLRRWDQFDASATKSGVPLSANWIELENGIQVSFGAGQFTAGDAWTIPARNATGQIEWPPCDGEGAGKPFQPPHYARIRAAPLACLHLAGRQSKTIGRASVGTPLVTIDDCRRLFPALTELAALADANAMHVQSISWTNDASMTFDALIANGLSVTFDQTPVAPVTPANFIVTLEMPVAQAQADRLAAAAKSTPAPTAASGTAATDRLGTITFAPIRHIFLTPTTPRELLILDSSLEVSGNKVTWTLPYQGFLDSALQNADVLAIQSALLRAASNGWPARVRVRIAGRMMYAASADGSDMLYLDGQAFGQTVNNGGSEPRIDLRLPSGANDKASDFESWFYVTPTLQVNSVSVTPPAFLIATSDGYLSFVQVVSKQQVPVTPQITVTLNYAPLVQTTVNLSLAGDTSVIRLPSTAIVPAGSATSTPVDIVHLASPNATLTYTLTASIPDALGNAFAQSTTFTVGPA